MSTNINTGAKCHLTTYHHKPCGHDFHPGFLVRCATHCKTGNGAECKDKGPLQVVESDVRCPDCQGRSRSTDPQHLRQTADEHWDRVHARQLKKALKVSEKEAPAYARGHGFESEDVAREMSLEGTKGDFERQLEKARMESLESAFEYFRMRRDQGVGSECAGSTMSGESSRRPRGGLSGRRDAPAYYEEEKHANYGTSAPPQRPSRLGSLFRKAADKLRGGGVAQGRMNEPVENGLLDNAAPSRASRRSKRAPSRRGEGSAAGYYQSEAGSIRHNEESGEELEQEDQDDGSSTGTIRPGQNASQQYEVNDGPYAGAYHQWPPQPMQAHGVPYPGSGKGSLHTPMPANSAPAVSRQRFADTGQAQPPYPQKQHPQSTQPQKTSYGPQQPQIPLRDQQSAVGGYPSQSQGTWQFSAQRLRSPSPAATLGRVMSQHGDEESRRQDLFTNHPHRPPTGHASSSVASNDAGRGVNDGNEGTEEVDDGEWESEEAGEGDDQEDDAKSAYLAPATPSVAPSARRTNLDGYGATFGRPEAGGRPRSSRR